MAAQIAPLRLAARNSAGRNAVSDRVVAQLQSSVRHRDTPANRLLDTWLKKLLLDASEPYGRAAGAGGMVVVSTRVLPPGFVTSSYYADYRDYVAQLAGAAAAAGPGAGYEAASLTQFNRRVSVVMDQHNVKRRTDHGTHVFCDCCTAWHGARASAAASGDAARGARLFAEHRAHLRCIAAEHQLGQLFAALAVDCTRTDRPGDIAAPGAPAPGAPAAPLAAAAAAPAGPGAAAAGAAPPGRPAVSLSYFIIDRPSTTPMVKELRASKSWAHSKDFIFSGQGIYSAAGGGAASADPRVSVNYSTRIFVLGANKTVDALVRELLLLPVDGLSRTIVINCDNSAAEVRNGGGYIFLLLSVYYSICFFKGLFII
jgi:hypothetical protein